MAGGITVLIPARNEQASIGACLESILAQAGLEDGGLQVWVADDSSSDHTAAIVREMACRDARVHVITVPALPPGWIGKNHALHVAVEQALQEIRNPQCRGPRRAAVCPLGWESAIRNSNWLLFTDADTIHEPDSLRRVIERAEREQLDLFSLSPQQQTATWYEKAVIPRVYRALDSLYSFERINDPRCDDAAANGQYLLIRQDAYERIGGHAAVRNEMLEDVALARNAKQAGLRIRFESGTGLVSTRMYRSWAALWQGWAKNLYLLYGRRPARVLAEAAWIWLADVVPLVFVASAPLPLLGWLAARHAWYAFRLHQAGESPRLTMFYWPGSVIFSMLLAASLIKYVTKRPVSWKGRAYQP